MVVVLTEGLWVVHPHVGNGDGRFCALLRVKHSRQKLEPCQFSPTYRKITEVIHRGNGSQCSYNRRHGIRGLASWLWGPWAEFAVTNAPAGLYSHAPSRPRGLADGVGVFGLVKQAAILVGFLLAIVEHGNRFARGQGLRGDELQEWSVSGVTVSEAG